MAEHSYQLLATDPAGTTTDLTQRVGTLSWSGSVKQMARELSVTLAAPTDGSLPEPPTALGNGAALLVDGKARFTGVLTGRQKATQGSVMELSALDRGWYLAQNEGWYSFSGITPEAAVKRVCGDFGIPVGALAATGKTVSRKFAGAPLYKIIDTLYTLAAEQDGRRYLARFDGEGKLEVAEKPTAAALELAPGKNLQTLTVKEDISKLQNRVAIYSRDGRLVRTVEDGESVERYGSLQHVLTQRDGADAGAEAKAWLEDNGLSQTMTVECLGHPDLISGSAVLLRGNTAGVAGLCWIDSDTHTWKNGQYFCRLTLNFRNLMNETSAGSEL